MYIRTYKNTLSLLSFDYISPKNSKKTKIKEKNGHKERICKQTHKTRARQCVNTHTYRHTLTHIHRHSHTHSHTHTQDTRNTLSLLSFVYISPKNSKNYHPKHTHKH